MNFLIRPAAETDYHGLEILFEEIDAYHRNALPRVFRKPEGSWRTPNFLLDVLADPNAVIFAAGCGNQIIGLLYAYIRVTPEIPIRVPCGVGEVDQLVAMERYRRCGVGKALMERAHQWAGEMRLDRLELSVWNFNTGALAFYRALGYEPAFHRMWKSRLFPDTT